MEITLGYAIAAGGILLILALTNLLPLLPQLVSFSLPFFRQASRYLKYYYLIDRHRYLGPWTFADLIIQLLYIGINSFCIRFRVPSIAAAGIRAGNLSLLALIPLFLGPHLSFLADVIGVSLSTFQHIHRSAGLMSLGLALFHTLVIFTSGTAFTLHRTQNRFAVVAGSALGAIIILSWPPLRKRFYEIFLRLHHLLAGLIVISILLHVPPTLVPQMYFYIATAGTFVVTLVFEGGLLLFRNGVLVNKIPAVKEIFKFPEGDESSPVQLTISLQEPLGIKPPQHINIWIPSLSVRSRIQTHPFVVTSWTGKDQTSLELFIEPRHGWTKRLQSKAVTKLGHSGGLVRVLFTGPHGIPVPVDRYEYVFIVASSYGIIPHLPLLERLVQGALAHEVRARRIRLIWELEDGELFKAVCPLINWILYEDRRLENNCTLAISLYSMKLKSGPLGKRAEIFNESMPLKSILEDEIMKIDERSQQMEAKDIEAVKLRAAEGMEGVEKTEVVEEMEKRRAKEISEGRKEIIFDKKRPDKQSIQPELPVYTRTPRMLITASASTQRLDDLKKGLLAPLNNISLVELDYQPSP